MSDWWNKRVWYEDRENTHAGDRISQDSMEDDWRYTKTHAWFVVLDTEDLKMMMRSPKDGIRHCIITYERVL